MTKKAPNFHKAFINKRQINSSAPFKVSKATVVLTSFQRISHSTADFHPMFKGSQCNSSQNGPQEVLQVQPLLKSMVDKLILQL